MGELHRVADLAEERQSIADGQAQGLIEGHVQVATSTLGAATAARVIHENVPHDA